MNSKISGIVLKSRAFGDNDLILTILSAEAGKIDAIAKGVKRSKKSPLYTQLFAYSDFSVYKGRNFYTINSADTHEAFYDLRNDISALSLGQYFLEVAASEPKATVTGEEKDILRLILNSLFLLCKASVETNTPADISDKRITDNSDNFANSLAGSAKNHPKNDLVKTKRLIIKIVFELKYASLCGFMPELEKCSSCGETELWLWEFGKGIFCAKCASGRHGVRINSTVQKIITHILSHAGTAAYSFKADEELLKYLSEITEKYLSFITETNFKSLDYYKTMDF